MILDLSLIISLILLNCFFAASEVALLTVRRTRIEELALKKNRTALLIRSALKKITHYITAIQIGSTASTVALGWFGQPFIEKIVGNSLFISTSFVGSYVSSRTAIAVTSFFAITTLQLIFGEIVPRTAVVGNPNKYSGFLIGPLTLFVLVFKPFVYFLEKLSKAILTILGIAKDAEDASIFSEKEIKIILALSRKKKVITDGEKMLTMNVFKLKKLNIARFMIRSGKLRGFYYNQKVGEIKREILRTKLIFNRYPIFTEQKNKIAGDIHITDIFNHQDKKNLDDKPILRTGMVKKVIYVKNDYKADKIVSEMKRKRVNVAAVLDGTGKNIGLVTLTDVIKYLV